MLNMVASAMLSMSPPRAACKMHLFNIFQLYIKVKIGGDE